MIYNGHAKVHKTSVQNTLNKKKGGLFMKKSVKAHELSYYFILQDLLKMLEKKQYQKKDFKKLCNSIMCMLFIDNELNKDTIQLEKDLFYKLKSMGYYDNI